MTMERSLPRAMQPWAPLKEDEADRVISSAWGLIVAVQVPISWVTRCDGCDPWVARVTGEWHLGSPRVDGEQAQLAQKEKLT